MLCLLKLSWCWLLQCFHEQTFFLKNILLIFNKTSLLPHTSPVVYQLLNALADYSFTGYTTFVLNFSCSLHKNIAKAYHTYVFFKYSFFKSETTTAWKVSVFGVFLVRIFRHSRISSISPFSVPMRENTDQKNSEYGHFSRSKNHETIQLSTE